MSIRPFFIIAICLVLGSATALPAALKLKQRRQVVQPTWLMRPDLLPQGKAFPVRVTPQNLQETAEIRANIQKAVNEGSYVVAASPQQFLTALSQMGYNNGQVGSTFPMPTWPTFTLPNMTWWTPSPLFG